MGILARELKKTSNAEFVRVALVLPTEFAYARGVLRGIIAATRQRKWAGWQDAVRRTRTTV